MIFIQHTTPTEICASDCETQDYDVGGETGQGREKEEALKAWGK